MDQQTGRLCFLYALKQTHLMKAIFQSLEPYNLRPSTQPTFSCSFFLLSDLRWVSGLCRPLFDASMRPRRCAGLSFDRKTKTFARPSASLTRTGRAGPKQRGLSSTGGRPHMAGVLFFGGGQTGQPFEGGGVERCSYNSQPMTRKLSCLQLQETVCMLF